jgi:hypothetical protein
MALCSGIVLEEALDLSFDRLLMMMMKIRIIIRYLQYFIIILIVSTNYIYVHLLDNKVF